MSSLVKYDWDYMYSHFSYATFKTKKEINYIAKQAKNYLTPNDLSMDQFNSISDFICELIDEHGWPRLSRTKSGGISIDSKKFFGCGWDIVGSRSCVDLILVKGVHYWHFMFKNPAGKDKEIPISGSIAFWELEKEAKKDGVDLEDLAISPEEGEEVKKEIESPKISLYREELKHRVIKNAHHVDFHSSHPAGMAKYYPELRPAIERIYDRKETGKQKLREWDMGLISKEEMEHWAWQSTLCKAILNESWGIFQSQYKHYKWAHISRDAIHDTNERLMKLADELIAADREIIAFNTDGIWYSGEIYHGEGEGPGLGQWGHDHTNCTIRFKSAGCYEYLENGKYKPVVRGYTALDQLKPREEWEWGDIYKSNPFLYVYRTPDKNRPGRIYKTYDTNETGV